MELFSLLCGEKVFVSIPDLFDFLRIKNLPKTNYSSVEGYILNQNDTFLIDAVDQQVTYKGKTYKLQQEDIRTSATNLYLKSEYFRDIFGLLISSSIRTMSIDVAPNFELPSLRAARREKLRENLQRLKSGTIAADSSITREKPLFRMGVADLNLYSSQSTQGDNYNLLNLGLGGMVTGGEFSSSLNYSSNQPFSWRNQSYRWRYVNNEHDFLRQISIGKINARSVSTLYDPVVGVHISSATTYLKRSFGTYQVSDYTQPDWMVELYINNVLVDFVQADASGFFSFDVPLMYGSTAIELRQYGPYGEEKVLIHQFNIPFMFLPKKEFEYNMRTGVVEDGKNSIFAQASMNYGLTNSISIGGGMEYFSSLEKNPVMPFVNAAVRLPWNMLLSGQYTYQVGFEGHFSYTSPRNLRLNLRYAKYNEEQQAIRFSYLEERELQFSLPVRLGQFQGISRLTLQQNMMHSVSYFNPQWFLSARAFGVNFNFSTNGHFNKFINPLVYSRLSSSIQFPLSFTFTPQVQYEYGSNNFTSLKGELRKRIFNNGFLRTSYEQNFKMDQFFLSLGLTFELGFSRVGISGTTNGNESTLTETANGSLLFDSEFGHMEFSNRTSLNRANVKFIAFLDVNANGQRDAMELQLQGVEVNLLSNGQKKETKDGATLFSNLEPYIDHHFTINTDYLNRIAWSVYDKSLNVQLNPNQITLVEIPVSVVGEVGGFVLDSTAKGFGGIRIQILDDKQQVVKKIISESDGFFSYLGLKSGVYTAQLDKEQLGNLELESNGPFSFEIRNTEEGDIVDDLEFVVQAKSSAAGDVAAEVSAIENNEEETAEAEEVATEAQFSKEQEKLAHQAPVEIKPIEEHSSEEIRSLEDSKKSAIEEQLPQEQENIRTEVVSGEKPLEQQISGKIALDENIDEKIIVNGRKETSAPTQEEVDIATGKIETKVPEQEKKDERQNFGKHDEPEELEKLKNLEESTVTEDQHQEKQRQQAIDQNPEGLSFKVQLAASPTALNLQDSLAGRIAIESHWHKGYHKYTTGSYASFAAANEAKNYWRSRGFPGAFVVPFHDGIRLSPWLLEGKVWLQDAGLTGIGGIEIGIYSKSGQKVAVALTEADGSFQVPGLVPGNYRAVLNEAQLNKNGLSAAKTSLSFSIKRGAGVSLEKPEFVLKPEKASHTSRKAESYSSEQEKENQMIFKVQVLASNPKLSVNHRLLKGLDGVERYEHRGMYKYTWGQAETLKEVRQLKAELIEKGFLDAFIVPFYNGKRFEMQEASGKVGVATDDGLQGLEGINVAFHDIEEKILTSVATGRNGRFGFLGLRPGQYVARLDTEQLDRLGLHPRKDAISFEIKRESTGDQRLDFVLEKSQQKSERKTALTPTLAVKTDNNSNLTFKVQVAASNVRLSKNHPALRQKEGLEMHIHQGQYKYTFGESGSFTEIQKIQEQLKEEGFTEAFVVAFRKKERLSATEFRKLDCLEED